MLHSTIKHLDTAIKHLDTFAAGRNFRHNTLRHRWGTDGRTDRHTDDSMMSILNSRSYVVEEDEEILFCKTNKLNKTQYIRSATRVQFLWLTALQYSIS